MVTYEEVKIKIQSGDKIKSERGILMESYTNDEHHLVYELEYMGQGKWRALSNSSIKKVTSKKI